MAREFKDWDKAFNRRQITECREKYLSPERVSIRDRWPHPVLTWSPMEIREAAYLAVDSQAWQLVRVSMKGLPTLDKLEMLYAYQREHSSVEESVYRRVRCRVDNYLNALKRAGILDDKLRIRK